MIVRFATIKWGTNEIGSYYRTIDDYPMKIKVIAQVIKDLAIKVNPTLDFETYIFLMVFAASKITNKIVGVDTIDFSYQLGDTRYA